MSATAGGIRRARPDDYPAIQGLLAAANLPLDGVPEAFQTGFVAEDDERIVGAAALECFEEGGLLRSVVVDPSRRGSGLGQRLTAATLELARGLGLPAVYLLTTTAEGFFPKLGFEATSRAAVPASVQQSIEFRAACPATAVAMALRFR
jgi:amino-acid N-acetyltransferase